MTTYYKYEFTSPEPIFAIVKEELKSYFESGAVDDLMFPTYLNKCLDKLGKGTYKIIEDVLYIEGYEARLPDNFYKIREAWLCADINGIPYRTPNSFYSQASSIDTIQLNPVISGGTSCQNSACTNPQCSGIDCMPEVIQAVYKTNQETTYSFRKMFLLRPGNVSVHKYCSSDCVNLNSSAPDSFDIRDNKFVVNFSCGTVYLLMYVMDYDAEGYQMIPNNYRIKEYIEAFLKYKMFETVTNQVSDETFNQVQQKMLYYKSLSDEAYILALSEIRRQTAGQKVDSIKRTKNSLQRYELPDKTFRRRRN